jgi:hypothetical protein
MGDIDEAEANALAAAQLVDRTRERLDGARVEGVLARVAVARNKPEEALARLARVKSFFHGVPVMQPWGLEAHATPLEVMLDLIESGHADAHHEVLEWGTRVLSGFASVFPMARPRHHLLAGRMAAVQGRERAARGELARALKLAEQMDASWDAREARRRLDSLERDQRVPGDLLEHEIQKEETEEHEVQ